MREIIILELLIAISCLALCRAELKLTQVQVLFRHGERTPLLKEMYPNDIHNLSSYEPWGLGQLTNMGKRREYKIGQILKTRYQELLGPHYLPTAIYAVSTDIDRTKMSLQLVLAGLFPPSEVQKWNSELPWIPIPNHYIPEALDVVLIGQNCPEFKDEVSEVLQLPEIQARIALHNDLFEFLSVKTGVNITIPKQTYNIFNLFAAQRGMNLTSPEWYTDEIFQKMGEITSFHYEILTYTPKLRRIYGGRMVRKFIENMHLDSAEENPRKMYLYSAHELTIAAFLRAQGILESKLPLYGTAVMIEKLKDTDGKNFIRMVLWTGVTEQLITLRLPGCEEICPIEKYLYLTRELIPSDEEKNCHWRHLSSHELRNVFNEKINFN